MPRSRPLPPSAPAPEKGLDQAFIATLKLGHTYGIDMAHLPAQSATGTVKLSSRHGSHAVVEHLDGKHKGHISTVHVGRLLSAVPEATTSEEPPKPKKASQGAKNAK